MASRLCYFGTRQKEGLGDLIHGLGEAHIHFPIHGTEEHLEFFTGQCSSRPPQAAAQL